MMSQAKRVAMILENLNFNAHNSYCLILQLTIIFPKTIRNLDCFLKLGFGGCEKSQKINIYHRKLTFKLIYI